MTRGSRPPLARAVRMKSLFRTSSSDERVRRLTKAALMKASAIAGKEHVVHPVDEACAAAIDRKPAQVQREGDQQQGAEVEIGNGEARQREQPRHVVGRLAAVRRRHDLSGMAAIVPMSVETIVSSIV